MEAVDVAVLRSRILLLEKELEDLKKPLQSVGNQEAAETSAASDGAASCQGIRSAGDDIKSPWPLDSEEYQRYGRQMIMPEVGLQGQLRLRNASVLIVGLGGLGSPAAFYLAGAGVGTLGLVDGDTVEISNLHRQILHTTDRVGQLKVESAVGRLRQLNPLVRYHAYGRHLTPATALDIFQPYDLILDCTDHPTSRYLISDAAVLSGKPVVSAAALRTDGQLLVLNNPPTTGPCYRCIFPKPPPADSVISCGDGGVLGPVVGVMGVLMALEAIKIITGPESRPETCTPTPSDEPHPASPSSPSPATMLIFAATSSPPFRSIRLHGKRPRCPSCSPAAPITRASLTLGSLDYVAFCGRASPTAILGPHERITAQQLQAALARPDRPILLDVRDPTQYAICSLPGSVNVPLAAVDALAPAAALQPEPDAADPGLRDVVASDRPVYALCRFGNDSQLAVRKLKELGYDRGGTRWIGDVRGGLRAWKRDVDPLWPEY